MEPQDQNMPMGGEGQMPEGTQPAPAPAPEGEAPTEPAAE